MKLLALWMCSSAFSGSANAEELAVSLDARVWVIQSDGARRTAPVQRASPGDVIEYRVTYRNTGSRVLKQVQATLPVPLHTTLIPLPATLVAPVKPMDASGGGSALPPAASRDGQRFEPSPLRESVQQPDGSVQWRDAPLSVYRYLRWPLGDLAAGKSKTVTAFVRVVRDAPDEPITSIPLIPARAVAESSTMRRQP